MGKLQGKGWVGCNERNEMNFGNEKVRIRVGDDRISSLPDEIIHHILSFNDTRYAVQTSVLSSRWKFIWKSLPYLNFAPSEYRTYHKFTKFVNRILSFRYNQCEVSSLYLCFDGSVGHKFVGKIGNYVMSHNVQKMEIFARSPASKEHHIYPLCFFSSESLKCLTLRSSLCFCKYPLPQIPWDFPALTVLYLHNMWLCGDDTKCIELFSKCVNLKNLTIRDCRPRGWAVMKIITPRLENLSLINDCQQMYSNFMVSAPNLSSFYFVGNGRFPPTLSTGDLPSLDKVNLHLTFGYATSVLQKPKEDLQRLVDNLFSLFEELRNAKFLTLHHSIIAFLSVAVPDVLEHQPSGFSNLKCLNIEFGRMEESINSAMIGHVIKYLFNSSSSINVIMEISEKLCFENNIRYLNNAQRVASERRDMQKLYEVVEMLSSLEMTDPHARQALEDVKQKLALDCRKLEKLAVSFQK